MPRIVTILGLAFKPDTDDTRESAAIFFAEHLASAGVVVKIHDPVALLPAELQHITAVTLFRDVRDALSGADACLLVTAWHHYSSMDDDLFASLMSTPYVYDGRGLLRRKAFLKTTYCTFGCSN